MYNKLMEGIENMEKLKREGRSHIHKNLPISERSILVTPRWY
jgi:hypothetical protein